MARILVVEDSPTQAQQIRLLLTEEGHEVAIAANGREGLEAIRQKSPGAVLTDLHMPEMNGLELVEAIRCEYPTVPVILMTQFGSEEIAVQALQKGAASYVPKRALEQDIVGTLARVLAVAGAQRDQQRLLECLVQAESQFFLNNDQSLIAPLNGHVHDAVAQMKLCDETGMIRLGVALHEALVNAICHGNLEVSSELREGDGKEFAKVVEQRRHQEPYRGRRLHVTARVSRFEAALIVRDEGPGFDASQLPDPTDPANLEKLSGRGLLLIRTFMDQVCHNESGNEITMIKRRD